MVVATRSDPAVAPGVVWVSGIHRQWLGVSLGEELEVESVDLGGKGTWLGGLDLEVSPRASHSSLGWFKECRLTVYRTTGWVRA